MAAPNPGGPGKPTAQGDSRSGTSNETEDYDTQDTEDTFQYHLPTGLLDEINSPQPESSRPPQPPQQPQQPLGHFNQCPQPGQDYNRMEYNLRLALYHNHHLQRLINRAITTVAYQQMPAQNTPSQQQNHNPRLFSRDQTPIQPRNQDVASTHIYIPMRSAVGQHQAMVPRDAQEQAHLHYELARRGFSRNYRGNPFRDMNRSADIPDYQNCSFFIVGLPSTLTTTQLLASICDVGRVFQTHINPPDETQGHRDCAAKVIFFQQSAAQRFFQRHSIARLPVAGDPTGRKGRVFRNRVKRPESEHPHTHTRVLMITGPAELVRPDALTAYFRTKFTFQIDQILERGLVGGWALVEYRFGSYDCQAQAGRMAILREMVAQGVSVAFGRDPCDVSTGVLGVAA